MHLFDSSEGPHMAHFHAWHRGNQVQLYWEVRNTPPLKWRVLRSEEGCARTPDVPGENRQVLVMEGADTHAQDDHPAPGESYYYTVFALDEMGKWERQVEARVHPHDRFRWLHPDREPLSETDEYRPAQAAFADTGTTLQVGGGDADALVQGQFNPTPGFP